MTTWPSNFICLCRSADVYGNVFARQFEKSTISRVHARTFDRHPSPLQYPLFSIFDDFLIAYN